MKRPRAMSEAVEITVKVKGNRRAIKVKDVNQD